MSRKHFEALADALALCRPDPTLTPALAMSWRDAVAAVASVCAATNPRFDRARFVEACEHRTARS